LEKGKANPERTIKRGVGFGGVPLTEKKGMRKIRRDE